MLRIRVLEGDGAVRPAGSRGNGLTLAVTDELGRPVPQATVSLQLPDDGPSGVFSGGLRTEIALTDGQGRASVRGFRVNSLPGPFDIRITAAKQSARAGMLCRQYVAGTTKPSAAASKSSRRLWIAVAGVVAGAAVAGMAARGGGSGPAASSGPPAVVPPPSVTIGAPVEVSVGAP